MVSDSCLVFLGKFPMRGLFITSARGEKLLHPQKKELENENWKTRSEVMFRTFVSRNKEASSFFVLNSEIILMNF